MPTYEYACDACKHGFEVEQRITEPFLRDCPSCGKPALTRLVGTGNFILKGSGWYSDLYSGSGATKSESSETASESSSSESASAKAEAPSKSPDTSASKSSASKKSASKTPATPASPSSTD